MFFTNWKCSNQHKNIGTDARRDDKYETTVAKCSNRWKFYEKWSGFSVRLEWTSVWIPAAYFVPILLCKWTEVDEIMVIHDKKSYGYDLQELFPLTKDDFMAHLKAKHQCPISSGSTSFSSDFFPEIDSTISQSNGHSTTTSPDVNIDLFCRYEIKVTISMWISVERPSFELWSGLCWWQWLFPQHYSCHTIKIFGYRSKSCVTNKR